MAVGADKRMPRRYLSWMILIGITVAGGSLGILVGESHEEPVERSFIVVARQYGYEPSVIRVNRGDTVRLRFASKDVVHGFYLEGHDLDVTIHPMRSAVEVRHPSRSPDPEVMEEVVFTADRSGKFRYRCSRTCGFMHPFMLGEFIVGPNRLLPVSLGLSAGMLLGFLVIGIPGSRD